MLLVAIPLYHLIIETKDKRLQKNGDSLLHGVQRKSLVSFAAVAAVVCARHTTFPPHQLSEGTLCVTTIIRAQIYGDKQIPKVNTLSEIAVSNVT